MEDILAYYEQEQKQSPLTPNQLTLFFYFLASLNTNLSPHFHVQQILTKILQNAQQLGFDELISFVWSLGNYMGQFDLTIPEQYYL